jgi:hypothetical protein
MIDFQRITQKKIIKTAYFRLSDRKGRYFIPNSGNFCMDFFIFLLKLQFKRNLIWKGKPQDVKGFLSKDAKKYLSSDFKRTRELRHVP